MPLFLPNLPSCIGGTNIFLPTAFLPLLLSNCCIGGNLGICCVVFLGCKHGINYTIIFTKGSSFKKVGGGRAEIFFNQPH